MKSSRFFIINSFVRGLGNTIHTTMKKSAIILYCLILLLCGCSKNTTISFLCEDYNVDIYVNGNFIGNGLVTYNITETDEIVSVSCRNQDDIVLQRNFDVNLSRGQLIELNVPNKQRYSNSNSNGY